MTTISLRASFSLDHRLCMKLMGKTKAARPSINNTSSTKKSHRASPRYVFCKEATNAATVSTISMEEDAQRLPRVGGEWGLKLTAKTATRVGNYSVYVLRAILLILKCSLGQTRHDCRSQALQMETILRCTACLVVLMRTVKAE